MKKRFLQLCIPVLLLVLLNNEYAVAQNTSPALYSLGNASPNGWYKLGRLSLSQSGQDAVIRVIGGNGYNADINQNGTGEIHFRTSNGNSNVSGFYGSGTYYNTGRNVLLQGVRVVQIDQSTWDFYGSLAYFTGDGATVVVESINGTWTKDFTWVSVLPGSNPYSDLTEELIIQSNVGIGTPYAPVEKLDVAGWFRVSSAYENGIGGAVVIDANERTGAQSTWRIFNMQQGSSYGGGLQFWNYPADGVSNGGCCNMRLAITEEGNVGIGTANTQGYKLAVAGSAVAQEVVVKLQAQWPDYVFDAAYNLPTLTEVAKYIQDNKHLPNVPAAEEVAQKGIALGDNQSVLLKKIEELTLYQIDQDKKTNALEQQIADQNKLLQAHQQLILQLQKRLDNMDHNNK